jgi:hypothetical protein
LHGIFAFRLVVYYSQMISEEQEEPSTRRARQWAWAIPLSILLHAILVPLALVIFEAKLVFAPQAHQEPERVVATTSIRIDRRPVPRREGAPSQPSGQVAPEPQPRPRKAQPQALPEETPTPQPTPTPNPSIKPSPAPKKEQSIPLQAQIAAEQSAFRKTAEQLRQRNEPLSIATIAPQQPSSYHRSAFDVPGKLMRNDAQALLFPQQHWMENGLRCYYMRYAAQFSNGSSEEGVVPWPVCYPPNEDRFVKYPFPGVPLPIPYPQPGYVLPSGTYLSPFLERVYRKGSAPSPG